MELELTDFDLPQAIDNALTLVRERPAAGGSPCTNRWRRLGEIGGRTQGEQVLLNLLSPNLEGKRLELLREVPSAALAEISVTDTGVGIAPSRIA